jgi:Tol biopolymer transport system component
MGTRRVRNLGIRGSTPAYVEPGILTFRKDGELWGASFDPAKLSVGHAAIIAPRTANDEVIAYAAARSGALVVQRSGAQRGLDLVLVDRFGRARPLVNERRAFRWPRFSPDGRKVAVTVAGGSPWLVGDLWTTTVSPSEPGTLVRVTADSSSIEGEWDADGQHLVFVQLSPPPLHLERISADGSGKPEVLRRRPNDIYESAITPDRHTLVWREDARETSRDIFFAPLDSPAVAHPVRNSAFDERGFSISPDGRWLAYTSNESGSDEVYLCRLESNGPHWPVSRNGGTEPRWARNGELFFRVGDSVFVTRVTLGAEPKIATPGLLFVGQRFTNAPFEPLWDVSPDGRQFVMTREPEAANTRLVLMLDWLAAWQQRTSR